MMGTHGLQPRSSIRARFGRVAVVVRVDTEGTRELRDHSPLCRWQRRGPGRRVIGPSRRALGISADDGTRYLMGADRAMSAAVTSDAVAKDDPRSMPSCWLLPGRHVDQVFKYNTRKDIPSRNGHHPLTIHHAHVPGTDGLYRTLDLPPWEHASRARRQRGLPHGNVPEICVLDPDGDIVRHSFVRQVPNARRPGGAITPSCGRPPSMAFALALWVARLARHLPCWWPRSSSRRGANS
jgi:hypothetical protein